MNYLLAAICTLASLITIEECVRRNLSSKIHKLALALTLALLTVISTTLWINAQKRASIQRQAKTLLSQWPDRSDIYNFRSRGELIGLIAGTTAFFEANKERFSNTYAELQHIGLARIKNLDKYTTTDSYSGEMDHIRQTCLALKQALKSIAETH